MTCKREECGKEFEPRQNGGRRQIYCSEECKRHGARKSYYHRKVEKDPTYRDQCNAYGRAWRSANPERAKEWRQKHTAKYKLDALTHYGKNGTLQCCWAECDVTDVDMLTLDHIDNDGRVERQENGNGLAGYHTYSRLIREGFPAGFQTLCCNHQMKKEILRRRGKD